MSVGGIAINTPNYKSAAFPRFAMNNQEACYLLLLHENSLELL